MSPRIGDACGLLLAFAALAASQTREVSGWVRTTEDAAVARAEVSVDQAGDYVTTDSGKFAVPMLPPLHPGFPVIFAVRDWVIVDPCVNERGRTYLPDPNDADAFIRIRVLRPGDLRLLSGRSVGCVIEEKASRFESKPRAAPGPHASLWNGLWPEMAERRPPAVPERDASHRGSGPSAGLVTVAYRVSPFFNRSGPEAQERASGDSPAADEFVTKQAKGMGFTAEQLARAITEWTKSAEDPYEKGLAAFYEDRYEEASRYIRASIPSPPGRFVTRYVPLAHAEHEQGHYAAAEAALRKVLSAYPDDPLLLNNLGIALKARAKYADAEPLLKRALGTETKALGPDHPDVAAILSNLAELYRVQDKYEEAKPLYEQALGIEKRTLAPDDPETATSLNGLALVDHAQGRDAEAEQLYKQALEIDDKAAAREDPEDVAATLNNLGELYRAHNLFDDAEPLYKKAMAIVREARGPDHPAVAMCLNNLALLYHAEGKDAEAEPLYKQALAILKNALPSDHPFVAKTLDNLGELYRAQKRYSEAEPLFKQAVAIAQKKPGVPDQDEATYLSHLAALYFDQDNCSVGLPIYKHQMAIDGGIMALTSMREGKYSEGKALLQDALDILHTLHFNGEAKAFEDEAAKIRAKRSP